MLRPQARPAGPTEGSQHRGGLNMLFGTPAEAPEAPGVPPGNHHGMPQRWGSKWGTRAIKKVRFVAAKCYLGQPPNGVNTRSAF